MLIADYQYTNLKLISVKSSILYNINMKFFLMYTKLESSSRMAEKTQAVWII